MKIRLQDIENEPDACNWKTEREHIIFKKCVVGLINKFLRPSRERK